MLTKRRLYISDSNIRAAVDTLYTIYSVGSPKPRSQGSLLPALRSERERETLENAGHVAPEQN